MGRGGARDDGDPDSAEATTPGRIAPRLRALEHAWFLDVDGTLVEFTEDPNQASTDASLVALLEEAQRVCEGAVALISGRRLAEIDRMIAPLRLPAAGQHGAERRSVSGAIHRHAPASDEFSRIRDAVIAWAGSRPGVVLQDKGATLAVHLRQAPHLWGEADAFLRNLLPGNGGEFGLMAGKLVMEIRPSGKDKGAAVLEFMQEPPFRGRRAVFVGDDATDEDAFAVVNGLGGVTVKVGEGDSIARWRLPSVAAVRAWIRGSLAAGGGARGSEEK
jgi:trehalose 6-phosphate phosphatase